MPLRFGAEKSYYLMSRTSNDTQEQATGDKSQGTLLGRLLPPRIHGLNVFFLAVSIALALWAVSVLGQVFDAESASAEAHDHHIECTQAANDLQLASDLLATDARLYVSTGDLHYLFGYLIEANDVDRRGHAVQTISSYLEGTEAHEDLLLANELSQALSEREYYAMRLMADSQGVTELPQELHDVQLSAHDAALDTTAKQELAQDMLLGSEYRVRKSEIAEQVNKCITALMAEVGTTRETTRGNLTALLDSLRTVVILLLAIGVLSILVNYTLVIRPMVGMAQRIREDKRLDLSGAYELRYVVRAYNSMYDAHAQHTEQLKRQAETDPLTGLYNRGAYQRLIAQQQKPVALIIVDVDKFKRFNDTFGHETGDEVLRRVAQTLERSFRTTDYVCRIGGDEFAVIMTDVFPDQRDAIKAKLCYIADALRQAEDDRLQVTLSVGVAFSTEAKDQDGLFREADEALYMTKHNGRDGFSFYVAA